MSATAITGFRIVGNNADRIGITSRAIGSVEFLIEGLKELRRGLYKRPRRNVFNLVQFP
jgi:hypothetical protein